MTYKITKRDGTVAPFDAEKIQGALFACFAAIQAGEVKELVYTLTHDVVQALGLTGALTVEDVQDEVERQLLQHAQFDAAKAYILYRDAQAKERGRAVPPEVAKAFQESKRFFPTAIQEFQFYDKYARFNHELNRRETWVETVDRTLDFLRELSDGKISEEDFALIRKAMLQHRAMPSMRMLAMAGAPARRNNACIYNCSYNGVNSLKVFVEALSNSMCGCGVGFSVERRFVDDLPRVEKQRTGQADVYTIDDSSEGWEDALDAGLKAWFAGTDVEFDYSRIRPAGSILKVKGGTSSGPEPLRKMLNFVRDKILSRQDEQLRALDVHDIMCVIGDCVVQGGVRRTAMISLFDWDDREMRRAKHGNWYETAKWRTNANNSMVWPDRELTAQEIAELVLEMNESKAGEPGIFSRKNAMEMSPNRRDFTGVGWGLGTNPCCEIVLRSGQFCNLTIAVSRPEQTYEELAEAVRIAAIIGTIQSSATYFPRLGEDWKRNCEEEALLGVDITGQMDQPLSADELLSLRALAVQTNVEYAAKLGINRAAAVTCVKPGGNSAVLLGCSSGISPRWSKYQIRNVQVGKGGAMHKTLESAGVPIEPLVGKEDTTIVASFPLKAPAGARCRKDVSAIEQCEEWKKNKLCWTEHNPSCTIYYYPHELIDLMQWLYQNQKIVGGMAFLPADDTIYQQTPNVEITEEQYNDMVEIFPDIDFAQLYAFEIEDQTTAAQELACMAGACDL